MTNDEYQYQKIDGRRRIASNKYNKKKLIAESF